MIRQREPTELLTREDIEELVGENKEFDRWLKREKKISNYPNASYDRDKRKEKLREIIQAIHNPTLNRIAEDLALRLQDAADQELEILQDIQEFLEHRLGVVVSTIAEQAVAEIREEAPAATVQPAQRLEGEEEIRSIGRVAPTLRTPITPAEFTFWVKDDENVHVEVGSIITAHNRGIRVTGLVSEIQAVSDVREVLDSFYAHAFGRPEAEMPTRVPVVLSAKVEVVRRSDGRMEPIRGTWPVTFASAKEIREAYGAEIPPENEVLAGFTYDDQRNPVPIGLDARYVVGYEAAHINIAGASGVATKTSYALFLLYALLAHSEQHGGSVAAIAFNVKEADLMFIDKLPESWDVLKKWQDHPRWGPSVQLWRQAQQDYCLDPIRWAQENRFHFFAPMHFRPEGGVLSQRREDVEPFTYGLLTLINAGVGSLYALFDPNDLDEKAVALIASMADLANDEGLTFEGLIEEVEAAIRQESRRGDWFSLGGVTHHRATANKILNRLNHALDNQLRGVVLKAENTDQPIPLEKLRPGQLWVVDITQLSDKGQRLIFQTVVRTVFRKLEERKAAELTGRWEDRELQQYPEHVVIFVDELNKFVPSGREFSVLKGEIVEMAARGRSVGLSLCGAQQLASKVDEEVLANTSTFAVGRSHPVEIRKPPYAWLAEGLKQKAMVLEKGWMLLWHTLHKRPVLVHFPLPLHHLKKVIEGD